MLKKTQITVTMHLMAATVVLFSPSGVLLGGSVKGGHKGTVVILDGTSTAGKTSIAKHLVKLLGKTYEKIAMDDFVTKVFIEQIDLQLPKDQFFQRVRQRISDMYDKINECIDSGKNVLLDTVLSSIDGQKAVSYGLERLQKCNVFMVLVYCPFAVVVERVICRNEQAILENNLENFRSILAVLRFADIYRPVKYVDEFFIDTLCRTDIEQAYGCSKKNYYEKDLEKLGFVKADIIKKFGLNDKEYVKITPRLAYDFIVDASEGTPKGCAKQVFNYMQKTDMRAFKQNCENVLHFSKE